MRWANFNMEYDYADQLDLEWQCLQRKHLNAFSCQNDAGELYLFEEVLEKVFSPGPEVEQEVNYKDKETCETCLTQSLQLLLNRTTPPRQTQIRFLLNIAKYTSKDETCFINLNANNVLSNLLYLSQPSNQATDKQTRISFLDLFNSCLEHHSGTKWLIESKCWRYIYKLVLDNQDVDKDISAKGYIFVAKLLEKTVVVDKQFCYEIIELIAGPLLNASALIEGQTPCRQLDCLQLIEGLKPSVLCLVEILERLLEDYSAGVLNCIVHLKVDLASDTVSKNTVDKQTCLVLDRIAIILSFFKLTDVLDGIKLISQDPLAVTGFLRIVDTEIDKGAIDVVFGLFYYALKYLKSIAEKLPKCLLNDRNVDFETEVVYFQLEPIMLILEKLDYCKLLKSFDTDLVRRSHLSKILQNLSVNTLHVARKVKMALVTHPFELFTVAVKYIIQSRHMYTKDQLATSFECLIYSLQDTVEYIKLRKSTDEENEAALQGYVLELLNAILLFIESFNLNWSDSVKVLELAHILHGGCSSNNWPASIVVQGLKLLQEIISRRLSPAMSLLIDCDEDMKELAPLLYQKCFTTEWEVRKAVLDVVQTIAVSANKSFPSFKNLLIEAALPHLISTMALNDENAEVKAAAFKCLREVIRMENMEDILPKNRFISKVLDVLVGNALPVVKQEAIKLITIVCMHQDGLEDKVLVKVYQYLENIALTNSDACVQLAALEFWVAVMKKHLANQGWMDKKFPSVTFSKRIVCMTNTEVRKRIYKVLNQLNVIGCLNVFEKISHMENLPPEANTYVNLLMLRINDLFREHEVTPESMLFNEEFSDFQSISSGIFLSPRSSVNSSNSDEIIQEIINDTVMKLMPDDIEFVHDEDLYSLMETKCYQRSKQHTSAQPATIPVTNDHHIITPSEFVDFVYKRVALISHEKDGLLDQLLEDCPPKADDVYNVIDY